jgi:hypothetical protein
MDAWIAKGRAVGSPLPQRGGGGPREARWRGRPRARSRPWAASGNRRMSPRGPPKPRCVGPPPPPPCSLLLCPRRAVRIWSNRRGWSPSPVLRTGEESRLRPLPLFEMHEARIPLRPPPPPGPSDQVRGQAPATTGIPGSSPRTGSGGAKAGGRGAGAEVAECEVGGLVDLAKVRATVPEQHPTIPVQQVPF